MSSTEASWAVKEQDRERISKGENKAEELKQNKRGKVCVCVLCTCSSVEDCWFVSFLLVCAYVCAECRDLKDSIEVCVCVMHIEGNPPGATSRVGHKRGRERKRVMEQ